MSSTTSGFIFYLAIAIFVTMILVRMIRFKRKGGAALVMDVSYLCLYCFLGGLVVFYLVAFIPGADWLWGLAFCAMFWGGFFLRAIPLFRQMREYYRSENA
ncbi:MAG: hypothetical protein ACKOA1_06815 [Bacteroidota bacterium]